MDIVGSYWDRKGENEIDIVAINEMKKNILFAEVKLNKSKISINKLKEKSKNLLDLYKDFTVELKPLSLENTEEYLV